MGRAEQRLYTVGDFWLAKRDQSPVFYIRWYDETAKTTRGRSTGCRSLDEAKRAILAHAEQEMANAPRAVEEATVVSVFRQFWDEHGRTRRNADAVDGSLRTFTAFLKQDKAGIAATVADIKPELLMRFQNWRMAPHGWDFDWRGKRYTHRSEGVTGEAVQRNLDDVRAALNHAARFGRIPYAPKVPSVATRHRSPPRDVRMSLEELGAIVGYAAYDLPALRWILAMLAMGTRPEATMAWDVAKQWGKGRGPNFDTHPPDWPRTKKRNPVVPIIPEFRPWLEAWAAHPHPSVKSRRTWWRTMRSQLGLPAEYIPKTIRHTVATELRSRGVPMDQIESLLGHSVGNRTTQVYAKYDPNRIPDAKRELSAIWQEVCASANKWLTNHFRVSACRGRDLAVVRRPA